MFTPRKLILMAGLLWLGLGFSLLLGQLWQQRGNWELGKNWGGDLKQHYAVAVMLDENGGNYKPLYRDFIFSKEITRIFDAEAYEEGRYLDRHNNRYSPLIAWFGWQLKFIPYEIWIRAWFVLSLMWAAAAWIFLRRTEKDAGPAPGALEEGVLFFAFPPLLYTLAIGQNAILTLMMVAASLWLLRERREWWAGIVFGSICYKPQLMPYVAGLMLLCGQWRFAFGAGISSVLWMLLGILLCGLKAHGYWLESLLEIIRGVQGDEMETNMPWKGFVLTVLPYPYQPAALAFVQGLGICFALALVYWVHRGRKAVFWRKHQVLSLILIWWLLFTPHVKAYDMVLALPLMMFLARVVGSRMKWARGSLALFYFAGFAACACRFLGFSPAAPLVTLAFLFAIWTLFPHLEKRKAGRAEP